MTRNATVRRTTYTIEVLCSHQGGGKYYITEFAKDSFHSAQFLTQPMDPEKKSLNFIFPTKYVIPKSLKFSHWLSEICFNTDAYSDPFRPWLRDRPAALAPGGTRQTHAKITPLSESKARGTPWANRPCNSKG